MGEEGRKGGWGGRWNHITPRGCVERGILGEGREFDFMGFLILGKRGVEDWARRGRGGPTEFPAGLLCNFRSGDENFRLVCV